MMIGDNLEVPFEATVLSLQVAVTAIDSVQGAASWRSAATADTCTAQKHDFVL
ncbi:hypothetical protein AB0M95_33390 [Sphaerisporangium sp. NPDC051017]|uniref:hypothetical protein n=1 Tax=Sphaerisporangium sp. NPDC051017 TaxID=3154636 RepID=UPI003445E54E